MNVNYPISFFTVERIHIIIVVAIGILFSFCIFVFPSEYIILSIVLSTLFIVFLLNPKIIIYFLIAVTPLIPTISSYTTLGTEKAYLSINIGGILNIGVTCLAICLLLLRKSRVFEYKLLTPMILFLGLLLLSIFFSPLKFMSLRQWFRYAMPAMVYFIVLESFNNPKEIKKLLKFILFSSIPILVVGFYQLISRNEVHFLQDIGVNRIYGTLGHPNTYAMFLIVLLLLTIYHFFESKMKYFWVYLPLFMCLVILLISTYTRVGWAAFFAAISIAGFLKYRKFYFLFLLVGVIVFLFSTYFTSIIVERLQPNPSFWQRFDFNQFGILLFKQNPILGHGVGSYEIISQSQFGTISQTYGLKIGVAPHNDYIRFLAEGGLLGLAAFLFLMYRALKLSANIFKSTDSNLRDYGMFLISLIVAILVFGITDQGFEYADFYFWLFLSIGEIYLRNKKGSKE
jgi:O-antigen ligase